MHARDLYVLGGVAAIAWLLLRKFKEQVDAGADFIAKPIAYIISSMTLPPAVHVNGGVVLPDGGYVSFDAIVNGGSKVAGDQTFFWRGVKYRVTKRRPDNNYDAVKV